MTKHIRIFGWYIYVSDSMMKRRQPRDRHKMRRRREINAIIQGGGEVKCEMCGCVTNVPTIHHVFDWGNYPQYFKAPWNQMVLCPNCHQRVHTVKELDEELKARKLREMESTGVVVTAS